MHLELCPDLLGGRQVSFLSFRKDILQVVHGGLVDGGSLWLIELWDGARFDNGGLHLFTGGLGRGTRGGIITLQLIRLRGGGGRWRRGGRGTGRRLLVEGNSQSGAIAPDVWITYLLAAGRGLATGLASLGLADRRGRVVFLRLSRRRARRSATTRSRVWQALGGVRGIRAVRLGAEAWRHGDNTPQQQAKEREVGEGFL